MMAVSSQKKKFLNKGIINTCFCKYPLLLFYSAAISFSIVLGNHLKVKDQYNGTIIDNYVSSYGTIDILHFILWFFILFSGLLCLTKLLTSKKTITIKRVLDRKPVTAQGFFWGGGFLILGLWFPYILKYYPGFIFSDSLASISEALSLQPLSNRNPVLFTLFLRLCLLVGKSRLTSDITAGCLIFSGIQMSVFAFSMAYLISWIKARFNISLSVCVVLITLSGLYPYYAQNSIAMWKDPFFSSFLIVLTLKLMDSAFFPELIEKVNWKISFVVLVLLVLFSRNNGITAILSLSITLFIWYKRNPSSGCSAKKKKILKLIGLALVGWIVITVPLYRFAGVRGTPREEKVGMMLNQMARVAALNGKMSEQDKEYLDEILPLDQYKYYYHPCTVDSLKWNERVDITRLYSLRFYKTYASLLIKNPRMYFEAWELESYGFWTVNKPEIIFQTDSISFGAPINMRGINEFSVGKYILSIESKLENERIAKLLPADSWSIPLGILNWLFLYVLIVLHYKGKTAQIIALVPQLGVILGILIGTPICYLPRYELSLQVLLPLLILLCVQEA